MSSYVAGFKYFFDIHMGLSRGPVNELMEIRVGDRPAWRGSSTDNTPIQINAPELFGGEDGEGGVQGTFFPLFGTSNQVAPVSPIFQTPTPGFRRRMTALFTGMISAMNPYPKPWKFKVRRTTAGWDGDPWYPEKATIELRRLVSVGEVPVFPGEGLVTSTVTTTVSGIATLETLPGIPTSGGGESGDNFLPPTPFGYLAYTIPIELPGNGTLVLVGGEGSAPVGEVYRISYGGWYDPTAGFTPTKEVLTYGLDWFVVGGNKLALNPNTMGGNNLPNSLPYPIYFTHTYVFSFFPPTNESPNLRIIKAMNPAHIIYECLTNREWGRGLPRSRFDDAVWRLAADQLWEEQFGLCIRWTRQQPIQQFVKTILDHINAVIYTDRKTSLIRLRLIRADYDRPTVPLYDTSNGLLEINEAPVGAPGPMTNEVKVKYRDPITDEDRVVRAVNLATLRASGGEINSTTKSYPGLPTQEIADRVAKRDLRATSTTLRRFSMTFDRRGSQFVPGGVIRIQDYARNIPDTVVRIVTVDYGSPRDGKIKVQAVQDVFGLPTRGFAALPPPSWTPPNRQPCVGMFELFEMPYRSVYRRLSAADLSFVPAEAGYIATALAEGQPLNATYDIAVRAGLPETEDEPTGEGSYCGFSRGQYAGVSLGMGYAVNTGNLRTLDVGYGVGAAGNDVTLGVGYSVMSSGNATLDIGYEIFDVVIEDVIVAPLEGTNGQTVGVPNNGTAGGTFTLALGASIQTEARYTGTSSLRLVSGNSSSVFLTLAPTTLVYTPGTPFNWDFAFRMEGGVTPDGQTFIQFILNPFFAGDNATSPQILVSLSQREDKDDISVSFDSTPGGQFARVAPFPSDIGLEKHVWHHARVSVDATGRIRGFVNGVDRTVFANFIPSLTGPSRRMQLRAFEGSTSPTYAGRVGFIDDIRLRYGEASTGAFTPPSPSRLQGNAKLSVGFEMEFQPEPPLFVRVSSEFTGTNGQTTGIANAGTLGGNLLAQSGSALSTAQSFTSPTSLLLQPDPMFATGFVGYNYGPIANAFEFEFRIYASSAITSCSGRAGLLSTFVAYEVAYYVSDGQIYFENNFFGVNPPSQTYALNTWHKVKLKRESSTGVVSLFVNDVLIQQESNAGAPSSVNFEEVYWGIDDGSGPVYIDSATLRLP